MRELPQSRREKKLAAGIAPHAAKAVPVKTMDRDADAKFLRQLDRDPHEFLEQPKIDLAVFAKHANHYIDRVSRCWCDRHNVFNLSGFCRG